MAKADDTYYQWFELLERSGQKRPGRRRTFQWKVEPGSGFILLRFWGALADDRVGITDEPAVALDVTDRLIGAPFIRFDGVGDTDYWVIDDEGVLNAFRWLIAVWDLDTGGANDADFSNPEVPGTMKEWVI